MARGLADAHHGDAGEIRLRHAREGRDRGIEAGGGLGIAHVVADVAAMQRLLVGMLEVEVGRDRHVSLAREAFGEFAGVAHQPVALVHHDDGGRLRVARGDREEGRHVPAGNLRAANAAHCAGPRRNASVRKSASMNRASGGGVLSSPMATRASRLALRPSSNSAESRAITLCLT